MVQVPILLFIFSTSLASIQVVVGRQTHLTTAHAALSFAFGSRVPSPELGARKHQTSTRKTRALRTHRVRTAAGAVEDASPRPQPRPLRRLCAWRRRGVGPVGDRGPRALPSPLARNYISHNYPEDAHWCGGSHGNQPPGVRRGALTPGPEGAETEKGAEKDCWPRPSVPTLRRPAFPALRDPVLPPPPPPPLPPGVSSGCRFPCQPRGVQGGKAEPRCH